MPVVGVHIEEYGVEEFGIGVPVVGIFITGILYFDSIARILHLRNARILYLDVALMFSDDSQHIGISGTFGFIINGANGHDHVLEHAPEASVERDRSRSHFAGAR